ncbi:ABC superfamily ATP binding cassette transporter, ABC protein [Dialister micraerophilus DSM 19965]|uniref:ABC superfamily ATP binding cassette transporter, ABC protein n=2 Tax=Dialister micraerophilus TaxID=309120 RepID=F2BXE3_9FIRM|nr:ABC superfamily ATP binding cassette transporter, ABC protein [Dialister micraerophilus DSM 19965]
MKGKEKLLIEVSNLTRTFSDSSGYVVKALLVKEFKLEKGEKTALIGPSGSGKTTFLHCLSALLSPTSGIILIDGRSVETMTSKEKEKWRATFVGYIFQKALLIPYLNVYENISLSAEMAGKKKTKKEIENWLEKVGLEGYGKRKPSGLSGGEQQRVSFIRAIIKEPKLILADEPTASLDMENGRILMKLLLDYQKESECMLICATHDRQVQKYFSRKFVLERERVPCT